MERGRFIPLPEILPFIDSRTGQIIYLPKEKSPLLDFYNPSMSRSTSMSSISSLGSGRVHSSEKSKHFSERNVRYVNISEH